MLSNEKKSKLLYVHLTIISCIEEEESIIEPY